LLNIANKTYCEKIGVIVDENFRKELGVIPWKPGKTTLQYSNTKIDLMLIQPGKEKQWMKGSRIFIGYEPYLQYATYKAEVSPDSLLFFTTDGLTDQFGGEENKKWGKKNISKLFEEADILLFEAKKEFLLSSIKNRKRDTESTYHIALLHIGLTV